ncbi:phosphate/phosphite/phosphonate ABC transporter substrate-binding protein [Hydrogenobacter sp. T-2]|uniref:phosphate/phosphite/phosphonate ABC transporter substrate-binding protein n=1 Tax=Pampinifervens diazotrophicum TaxID=1632018 RepID=UPI002B25D014|nr:phosphate/phosphite/phosphonate ABC transporter substrate-binding protein [Hydrogenobacter sp. T-2]WPM31324.1 phosphate/phosphite/phosphonate ABC transporter substrate-binding protein [Hydrogenobacter sp. T-2]
MKLLLAVSLYVLVLLPVLPAYTQEIKVGFTAVITREDAESIYSFLDYISKKTGLALKPVFAKSYDEMDYFLSIGKVDIAYICGGPYVEGRERYGYKILAVPLNHEGKPYYYSLVITRKEKPYKSILDFKGKPYAFSDPKSNSGSLVPTYILLKKGLKADEFFRPVVYTYSHYESILAVYKGFVEGASVDSLVYEQAIRLDKRLEREIKVVEKYGPFPITPFVYRRGLDNLTVERIKDALLKMKEDEEGRRILNVLGISGFRTVRDEFYKPIEEMLDYVKRNVTSNK